VRRTHDVVPALGRQVELLAEEGELLGERGVEADCRIAPESIFSGIGNPTHLAAHARRANPR